MANTQWALEPAHSEVTFKVRHMMISNVSGHFGKLESAVETNGDDISTAKVHFAIDVDSISTKNEQRDGHLKSPDFFDAANHPKITFESTGIEAAGDGNYKLHGNLTMRGVTHPVTFDAEYGGILNDGWGNIRVGFTVNGKVNRKDYGLNWSALTEAGGLVVGDDVKFEAHVEYVRPV
jgi:polyisoprenoid-binding protein YceI